MKDPEVKNRTRAFFAAILMFVLLLPSYGLERLEPAEGSYFGFNLPEEETIFNLTSRLGLIPSVYSIFIDLPVSKTNVFKLGRFLDDVSAVHGIAMLTIEPALGLEAVTEADCHDLASTCASYESTDIAGIFLRFGHEMNGNWYAWGQRPRLYKEKFQLLARAVHLSTTKTAMMWAPNYGNGYPFGKPLPERGSADFIALDTNGDGTLSDQDDMYEPYYPGDEFVDWVGLTLYHWGEPFLVNDLPRPMSFAKSLVGLDLAALPDFYQKYSGGPRRKPLAIPETAAFYDTEEFAEADEFDIKQTWWRQLFSISGDGSDRWDVSTHFPQLKCIVWFDQYKQEGAAQGHWVDWRVSVDPQIRSAFVRDIRTLHNGRPYFLTADDLRCASAGNCVAAYKLPAVIPESGEVAVALNVRAEKDCDLVIDLLDSNFVWQGGTRVPITAPGEVAKTHFTLQNVLDPSKNYRWSIFLTPRGSDYLSAITWYNGPNPLVKSADLDRDGASNGDEFIAGTSPQSGNDFLSVSVQNIASAATIYWPSKIGRSYQLYATADFKVWIPASDLVEGNGISMQLPLPFATWNRIMFFRMRVTDR